ncbi:MAG: SGNH/GDSL hydrolase family protein [Verrucomicrobiia bacterium]|jgi:lysophospholipase L1-like esterase
MHLSRCLTLGLCLLVLPGLAAKKKSPPADPALAVILDSNSNVQVRSSFSNLRHRIDAGKEVHVAFLGGSITQNTRGHTAMVPDWFRTTYPQAKFKFTYAGKSSTCSTSGAFRFRDHVWDQGHVDLLIVEFAVNDDQDASHAARECVRGMEGIVRQMRTLNPLAEIVMVHFVNPGMLELVAVGKTPTSIAAHQKVAEHYEVTTVNVAAEVADAEKQKRYGWPEYGGTHPKSFGYRVASNMIISAIKRGWQKKQNPNKPAKVPALLDEGSYTKATFVDVSKAEFSSNGKNWKRGKVSRELIPLGAIRADYLPYPLLRGEKGSGTVTLTFNGTAVGAFVLAGPDAGIIESRIDGGPPARHDLFHRFSGKLNYPRSVMFHTDLSTGEHRVELRLIDDRNPKSQGHAANIMFFEVNQ